MRAHFKLALFILALALQACGPTYPKEKLNESIKKLFKNEVGTETVQSRVVGKTLFVAFPIEGMVTTSLDLPKDVTEKLENAMLSLTRIAMSTDEKLDFTVLEASDNTWGVRTTFIRRIEDLKFMYYYKISRSDFDERFILETSKFDPQENAPPAEPRDLSLPDFMARWVAFRINFGSRTNLFLGAILGVDKVTPAYDAASHTLALSVHGSEDYETNRSSSSLSAQLLKNSVFEQMKKVEKKYALRLPKGEGWAQNLTVKNAKGALLFTAVRREWLAYETKDTDR